MKWELIASNIRSLVYGRNLLLQQQEGVQKIFMTITRFIFRQNITRLM